MDCIFDTGHDMIEVLKQMVEALEWCHGGEPIGTAEAIKVGKQAIAELKSQEPVATVTSETGADITMSWWHEPALPVGTKLFTHPPQRTWVGLTDEEKHKTWYEMQNIMGWYSFQEIANAIEAKLKELNDNSI
jgi:hypothetical protein